MNTQEHAQVQLDGALIDSIATFYEQFNHVMMRDEDWQLGQTLDGLYDVLLGGIGNTGDAQHVEVTWLHSDASRRALGMAATTAWVQAKLDSGQPYNQQKLQRDLDDLNAGKGKTYFDLVCEVFADAAPRVRLILA